MCMHRLLATGEALPTNFNRTSPNALIAPLALALSHQVRLVSPFSSQKLAVPQRWSSSIASPYCRWLLSLSLLPVKSSKISGAFSSCNDALVARSAPSR